VQRVVDLARASSDMVGPRDYDFLPAFLCRVIHS